MSSADIEKARKALQEALERLEPSTEVSNLTVELQPAGAPCAWMCSARAETFRLLTRAVRRPRLLAV